MNLLPKVSIVTACYNDPFIVEAVESALKQTYGNKEIILVNDGSSDLSVQSLFEELKSKVDIYIDQENGGQSIARNNGIKRASGKYILNLDSDDYFEPEFLTKAIEILETDSEIKIVTCKARRFTDKTEIDIYTPRGGNLNSFLFANSALGSSIFRKNDWEFCGGYEEELPILGFEDWELYLNILKNGGKAYVIPEVLFNYRIREGSTTGRIKHLKNDKFKHIITKHKELYIINFEGLIDVLFGKLNKADKDYLKLSSSPEQQLGRNVLQPLRRLKKILNI